MIALQNKIKGALTGAAIGAELSFARFSRPEDFEAVSEPADLFKVRQAPDFDWKPEPTNQWVTRLTPLIRAGVQAYLNSRGRATPEDFAAVLKDDEEIASQARMFDGLHSIQELLKEGMQPRLSGFGIEPEGLMGAVMPAVGIAHFADPERAYLDGVELASVATPRQAADWAALSAAAIAAAFQRDATPQGIVETVLRLAHENNKELFYELNETSRQGIRRHGDEDEFLHWWFYHGCVVPPIKSAGRIAYNPIRYILPLLGMYLDQPRKFLAALVAVPPSGQLGWLGTHSVAAVVAGAIMGALHGPEVFPAEWREWAVPIAQPWFGLAQVIRERVAQERQIVSAVEGMAATQDGAPSRLFDKIKGALLAGAIGNAMGSSTEGRQFWDTDRQYPGGVRTVLDPGRLETEDDNQMAMLLVETYIDRDGLPVMARHFGHTWREKLNRDHFWPQCMGHAYDLICQGWDPRIVGHWSVVTGSTVMCMEPVGFYNIADPGWAAMDATAISYMYQRGLDVTAAAMLAATVADALRPDATVESVLQAALDVAPREPLKTFDRRAFGSIHDYICTCLEVAGKYDDVFAARQELYDKCLFYNHVDPLELWGFALAMFKIAGGDVRQASIGGTNIGRDADTIAGRAAMLCGALNGTAGVPQEWIDLFSESSIERIDHNAARLTELISVKKLARMQARLRVAGG